MTQRRTPLSTRQRFKILQRDGFRCRYCGRRAGNVVLHIDHVHPVAAGGTNDDTNLVTACSDCNLGKATLTLTTDPPAPAAPSIAIEFTLGRKPRLLAHDVPETEARDVVDWIAAHEGFGELLADTLKLTLDRWYAR